MAVRYSCTVEDCAWEHDGERKTADADGELVLAHRDSHADPLNGTPAPPLETIRIRTRYGWLWPLVTVNALALVLALIGGFGETGWLSLLFPQIWGWRTPFGIAVGLLSIFAIGLSGAASAAGGADRHDRAYRALAGVTRATTIMFAAILVPTAVFLALISGGLSP